jgi:hypothetical protein
MNSAEIQFWGTPEMLGGFVRMIRRPGEEPDGYDSRHDFEFALALSESLGEAGETLRSELLKMKAASEAESEPEEIAQELVAV